MKKKKNCLMVLFFFIIYLFKKEMKEYVDEKLIEATDDILDRHHKEIDFLYKEVGILRCEMDLLS